MKAVFPSSVREPSTSDVCVPLGQVGYTPSVVTSYVQARPVSMGSMGKLLVDVPPLPTFSPAAPPLPAWPPEATVGGVINGDCFTARKQVSYPSYTTFCRGVGPTHWHYEDGLGNGYDAVLTSFSP